MKVGGGDNPPRGGEDALRTRPYYDYGENDPEDVPCSSIRSRQRDGILNPDEEPSTTQPCGLHAIRAFPLIFGRG